MSPRRLPSAVIALRMACTALVALAITVGDAGAEVLSFPSADGSVIDTNKLYDSTRFVGAVAVWFHQTYAISVECNPPRGCYAKSQLTNYHFSCAPRYVVVVERISFDLNGEAVKHEFDGLAIRGRIVDHQITPSHYIIYHKSVHIEVY